MKAGIYYMKTTHLPDPRRVGQEIREWANKFGT